MRKPAIKREREEKSGRVLVPLLCIKATAQTRPPPCVQVSLQLKLNPWNVRLGAILCYFFLLQNRAGCQGQQPRCPFTQAVLCSEHGTGSGLYCSLIQITGVTMSLPGTACRRNVLMRTGAPLTVEEVCMNRLFIGCQVHQEPGAASGLRKGVRCVSSPQTRGLTGPTPRRISLRVEKGVWTEV